MMLIPLIAAYILGSVPFGLLIARRVKNIDIREHGSRNIGATNVFRVVGKKWGILVFALDALKGFLAASLPRLIFSQDVDPVFAPLYCGVAAIIGHTFPVWLRFRGGKGVATSLGVFLGVAPVPTALTFGGWILIFTLSRIISLASLGAALLFPVLVFVFYSGEPVFKALCPVSLILAAFIFYTHRANIGRLLRGEEKKII